jgi:hypothetical protein
MQLTPLEKTLRTLGASLTAASFCGLLHASDTFPPDGIAPLHESASSWPWVALAAIVALLSVIALAARRHLPFGKKG